MRALDTNVLLRLILQDDEAQFRLARNAVVLCGESGEALFLTNIALCEAIWVLKGIYRLAKGDLLRMVAGLLETDGIVFESEDCVRTALSRWEHGPADFADYLIGSLAEQQGCRDTLTFDEALRDAPGYLVLS